MEGFFKKLNFFSKKETEKSLPDYINFQKKENANAVISSTAENFEKNNHLSEEEALTLAQYLFNLDLDINDLIGKKVLDVGSWEGEFKTAMLKLGKLGDLHVNFDRYKYSESVDVVGRAENLPFADDSMDLVIAHCSVPVITATSGNYQEIPGILREMMRVVRPGGKIRAYPVAYFNPAYPDLRKENLQLGSTVLEELDNLKKSYPKSIFRIIETERRPASESSGKSFAWTLEIIKGGDIPKRDNTKR